MKEITRTIFLTAILLTMIVAVRESHAIEDKTGATTHTSSAALRYAQAQNEQVFEVMVKGQKVAPEMSTIRVKQGDSVRIRWTTDQATEVHLHGYDIKVALEPGEPADMTFKARATGRFAITSHGFGGHSHGHHDEPTLVYVEVHP